MRSETNFRVSFFLKKAKLLKNGEASVAMRITVDGQRVENNIRKSILHTVLLKFDLNPQFSTIFHIQTFLYQK